MSDIYRDRAIDTPTITTVPTSLSGAEVGLDQRLLAAAAAERSGGRHRLAYLLESVHAELHRLRRQLEERTDFGNRDPDDIGAELDELARAVRELEIRMTDVEQ